MEACEWPDGWPSWESCLASGTVRFPGLLAGSEEAVWWGLGRLPPNAFGLEESKSEGPAAPRRSKKVSKQLAIRQALRMIGLGWIATNTTPYRIMVGRMFDAAKAQHASAAQHLRAGAAGKKMSEAARSKLGKRPRDQEPQDVPETSEFDNRPPLLPRVESSPIPASCVFLGPFIDDSDDFKRMHGAAVLEGLETGGVVVIRKAAPSLISRIDSKGRRNEEATIDSVSQETTSAEGTKGAGAEPKRQYLRDTMGNGLGGTPECGSSYYLDVHNGYMELQRRCLGLLLVDKEDSEERREELLSTKKAIRLMYSEGGENWAHQDNNSCDACPYQALLLLSQPGVDFCGGEFYVARQKKETDEEEEGCHSGSSVPPGQVVIIRNEARGLEAGDLVIFQAGKSSGWFHGVLPVLRGSALVCSREAIGLLQPS